MSLLIVSLSGPKTALLQLYYESVSESKHGWLGAGLLDGWTGTDRTVDPPYPSLKIELVKLLSFYEVLYMIYHCSLDTD